MILGSGLVFMAALVAIILSQHDTAGPVPGGWTRADHERHRTVLVALAGLLIFLGMGFSAGGPRV